MSAAPVTHSPALGAPIPGAYADPVPAFIVNPQATAADRLGWACEELDGLSTWLDLLACAQSDGASGAVNDLAWRVCQRLEPIQQALAGLMHGVPPSQAESPVPAVPAPVTVAAPAAPPIAPAIAPPLAPPFAAPGTAPGDSASAVPSGAPGAATPASKGPPRPMASLVLHSDGSSTLARARLDICLHATYELAGWAEHLRNLVPAGFEGGLPFVARGIACRVEELANVIMSGLADEVDRVVDLHARLGYVLHSSQRVRPSLAQ